MLSKKQLFTKGMLDISPHMLSVIPFGIICGAIGVELGFNPYLVYAMSIIIFGGASQIVFLQVLDSIFAGSQNLSIIRLFCISIIININIIITIINSIIVNVNKIKL